MKSSSTRLVNRSRHGFTLVELLIVIVVIAVLVSISVVTYSGIQDRANDTVVRSDLSSAQKMLELYRANLGWYPRDYTQWTNEFSFSKNAYHKSVHNVMFCLNSVTDNYALVVRSKSGSTYRLTPTGVAELGEVAVTPALACGPIGTTWDSAVAHTRHGYFESGSEPHYTDGWDNGWLWTD